MMIISDDDDDDEGEKDSLGRSPASKFYGILFFNFWFYNLRPPLAEKSLLNLRA